MNNKKNFRIQDRKTIACFITMLVFASTLSYLYSQQNADAVSSGNSVIQSSGQSVKGCDSEAQCINGPLPPPFQVLNDAQISDSQFNSITQSVEQQIKDVEASNVENRANNAADINKVTDMTIEQRILQQSENIMDESSGTNTAEQFASNFGGANDNNNEIKQNAGQNIKNVDRNSVAENKVFHHAGPVGGNNENNIIEESSTQQIENIDDGSSAINHATNHAHPIADSDDNRIIDKNEQKIVDIDGGSSAANDAENGGYIYDGSDNNNYEGVNKQDIENVDDDSSVSNTAHNEGRIGQVEGNSDNNEVTQDNAQDIKNVEDDSEAENEAENGANIEGSDNDAEQSNDQNIEDVDDDSSARNSGENGANIT